MDVKPPFAVEGRSFGCGNPPSSLLGVKIQEPAFWGIMQQKKSNLRVAFLYLNRYTIIFPIKKEGYLEVFNKKIVLCLTGIFILLLILSTYLIKTTYKHPKGEYIEKNIVQNELKVIGMIHEDMSSLLQLVEGDSWQSGTLTFEEYLALENELRLPSDTITEEKYQKDSYILREDWNAYYELVMVQYGQGKITKESIDVIAGGEFVKNEEGILQNKNQILTDYGMLSCGKLDFSMYEGNRIQVFKYEDQILDVLAINDNKIVLSNAYIIDEQEKITFFYHHYEITLLKEKDFTCSDMIADLTISNKGIENVRKKMEKVNGKLLRITDEEIEIENQGIYPISDELQIYQLYGRLCNKTTDDLRIGYHFTDFVIDDGQIVSCLIMKEEEMDTIRVLIKNSDYEGRVHESVSVTCDTGYTIQYFEDGKEKDNIVKKAGEKTTIEKTDLHSMQDRIKIVPDALSGNISLISVGRAQGIPVYRGIMEVEKEEEGLLLINEVLLEEYLYKVVPSEMPSSYPFEALKAQAVCARTYAYGKMLHAGLSQYGAHVDDSAGFQVYNNIAMQSETTRAVKETIGEVLWYEDAPIGAYYYSTSCGAGSDTSVWNGYDGESPSYLKPQMITIDHDQKKAEDLKEENVFQKFISNQEEDCFEKEEGWFRWTYEVEEIEEAHILEILQKRYEANSTLILTQNADGEFESLPIKKIGKIKDISIVKRNAGGVADELVIKGTKTTVKIISELNIRYVLADGKSKVLRKSGDEVMMNTLLPSGYFVIDTGKEKGYVVGYKLNGGGFGHGVGMSQNAAKEMSKLGMSKQDILSFFYIDSTIKTIQTRRD